MIETLSNSIDLSHLPSIVAETRLLQHFTSEEGAFLTECESFIENEKYFLAQAQSHDLAGFGRASSKRMAYIKAVAEFYERRLMREVFSAELSYIPKVLQTSNGFAVHFSQDTANQAAVTEAIERHLLQYSFMRDGWNGFELIEQKNIGADFLRFVLSKYTINGFRAGMVVATSTRFPGATFGYFADHRDNAEKSIKWTHAISEAIDKIEPFLKMMTTSMALDLQPIEQGILKWMTTPFEKVEFSKFNGTINLPEISIKTQSFNLAERWGLEFPFYGAYSNSESLLPLLVTDRIRPEDTDLIKKILRKFNLNTSIPERNPVL